MGCVRFVLSTERPCDKQSREPSRPCQVASASCTMQVDSCVRILDVRVHAPIFGKRECSSSDNSLARTVTTDSCINIKITTTAERPCAWGNFILSLSFIMISLHDPRRIVWSTFEKIRKLQTTKSKIWEPPPGVLEAASGRAPEEPPTGVLLGSRGAASGRAPRNLIVLW